MPDSMRATGRVMAPEYNGEMLGRCWSHDNRKEWMGKPVAKSAPLRTKHPYVTRKKRVSGGKTVIKGTRSKVAQIAVEYEHMGLSPDEIIQAHLHLMLAQVHGALGYYYENAKEFNKDIRADQELVQCLRAQWPRSTLEEKRGRSSDFD